MSWFDPSSWLSSAWGAMKPTLTDPLGLMAIAGTGAGLYGGLSAYNAQQNAYNQAINQARKAYSNQLATQQQANQLMSQPPPMPNISSALSNSIIQDAMSTAASQGLTGGGAMTDIVTQNMLRNYIPIYQMAQNQQQAQANTMLGGARQALSGAQPYINALQQTPSFPFTSSVSALPNYLMQQRLLHQQQVQAAQANHFWDRLLSQPSAPGAAYDWSYDVGSYDPTQGLGNIPNDYTGNITK